MSTKTVYVKGELTTDNEKDCTIQIGNNILFFIDKNKIEMTSESPVQTKEIVYTLDEILNEPSMSPETRNKTTALRDKLKRFI